VPVVLPDTKNTFHVDPATVELTAAGAGQQHQRLVDPAAGLALEGSVSRTSESGV
jgi:hypothetical protein